MRNRNTNWIIKIVVLAMIVMIPATALSQVEFTFEGMADMIGVDMVGGAMTVYGIANSPVSQPTPVPMDFFMYEYTVVVRDMVVQTYNFDPTFFMKDFMFASGTMHIYADLIATGTPGDYANPSTFSDGEELLVFSIDPGWLMHLDNPMGPPFGWYSGAGAGPCNVIGGTQMPLLEMMEYPMTGWTFAGTGISEPNMFDSPEPGYEYIFGVKILFPYDPTPTEAKTWGQLKTLYR